MALVKYLKSRIITMVSLMAMTQVVTEVCKEQGVAITQKQAIMVSRSIIIEVVNGRV